MESLSERRGALAGHGLFLKAPFGASGAAFLSFCLLVAFRVHCWVAAHANLGFPEKLVWKIGARLCVMGDRFFSQSHNLGMRFSRPLGTTRPLVRSRGEPISPSPFLGCTNSGWLRWRGRAGLLGDLSRRQVCGCSLRSARCSGRSSVGIWALSRLPLALCGLHWVLRSQHWAVCPRRALRSCNWAGSSLHGKSYV